MNKHTPGPWRYKPDINGSNYMLVYCSSLASEGDNLRGYCGEANARLIAAAPDLLEALEMVRDADNDCRRDGLRVIPGPARAKIDAAIAKAKGE